MDKVDALEGHEYIDALSALIGSGFQSSTHHKFVRWSIHDDAGPFFPRGGRGESTILDSQLGVPAARWLVSKLRTTV